MSFGWFGRVGLGGEGSGRSTEAEVRGVDPSGRFLFARSENVGDDIYVHGAPFSRRDLQRGDSILVMVEQSARGLRARTVLNT
jgi:cold shock CspA family protein